MDKFVIIETPCISKKDENIMAIINQDPRKVYDDKKSLYLIHETTKTINDSKKSISKPYSIKFKLYSNDDMTLYELECNRIISEKQEALQFESIVEFANWYKSHSEEIIKQIKLEEEIQQYMLSNRKR